MEKALEYSNTIVESYSLDVGTTTIFGRSEIARTQFWEGNMILLKNKGMEKSSKFIAG
jgi:hypothetical protein